MRALLFADIWKVLRDVLTLRTDSGHRHAGTRVGSQPPRANNNEDTGITNHVETTPSILHRSVIARAAHTTNSAGATNAAKLDFIHLDGVLVLANKSYLRSAWISVRAYCYVVFAAVTLPLTRTHAPTILNL